jgi:group II intron reverse transcriptase/maturase
VETKVARIADMAKTDPNLRFTSIGHLINEDMLRECHKRMKAGKATGVDGVTKAVYEQNLETNLTRLVERMKKKSYRPQPARRTYIPKDEHNTRPLGIPTYEDKLVQMALKRLLEAIYEQDFLDHSYGFRPKRGMHDALKRVTHIVEKEQMNYVVDADIKGFFNHVDHDWLMKFLDKRVGDSNIHRLVKRMLIAGIQEDGMFEATEEGTPQGSAASPLLANIYLHYVLDVWFEQAVKKQVKGRAAMVRFADDFTCMFQYQEDAQRFYHALCKRLEKFNLTVAEGKTKIIRFGRYAEVVARKEGLGKPETFDFLGFTHYCGRSRTGHFRVKRQTSRKKFKQKVKAFDEWMKLVRHKKFAETLPIIRAKLLGHYRYYGITDNFERMKAFELLAMKSMYKWLNRRSQRNSYSKTEFYAFIQRCGLPKPRIFVNIYK